MATPSPMSLSHIKVRHLMLIATLCEVGTLHKAAAKLNISQPAATAMLSDLEALMGIRLFDRSPRGVTATTHGCEILARVTTLLNEFDEFVSMITRLGAGEEPALRMGVVPQAFATYLPQAVVQFRAAGGCAIKAQEGTAKQLLTDLLEGRLDCVIGRLPGIGLPGGWEMATLRFENLYAEDICVVAGAGAPDLTDPPYEFEWLAQRQWVLQRSDSSVRHALNEAFLRAGVRPPSPAVETTNYMQSLALVSKSGFYTVAPRRAALMQEKLGLVQVLDLDLGVAPMQVSFINRVASETSAQLTLFRKCFRDALGTQ